MTTGPITRRDLMRASAGLGLVAAAGSPFALQLAAMNEASAQAASGPYRAVVCIFLFGGNDSVNTVLATDSDSWGRYFTTRNTGSDPIALMPPGTPAVALGGVSSVTGRTVSDRAQPEFWGGALPIVPNTPNPIPAGTNAATRTFAIHPLMQALMPVWQAGRLGVVANIGPLVQPTTKTQFNNRSVPLPANLQSHNDQQATWQAGATEGARRGWGGLIADQILSGNGTNAVFTAISTGGNTVFLAGNNVVQYQVSTSTTPAVRITSATGTTLFGSSAAPALIRETIRETSSPNYFAQDYGGKVVRSMDSADALNQSFTQPAVTGVPNPPTYTNPITGATETNALATQLQTVARMIASNATLGLRRQVFFVSIGGWDTHDVQNRAQGSLLARVAHGMAYFDQVLGNINGQDMRNQVTTFTASDFSRTFNTNGDGTDHAWGSHQFVMGGAVRGRDIFGQFPTLGLDAGSFNNPDMVMRSSFLPRISVDQLGATLGTWFGLSDSQNDAIFPNLRNFSNRNLGFLTA